MVTEIDCLLSNEAAGIHCVLSMGAKRDCVPSIDRMCTVNGVGINCVPSVVAGIDCIPSMGTGIDCVPSMGDGIDCEPSIGRLCSINGGWDILCTINWGLG